MGYEHVQSFIQQAAESRHLAALDRVYLKHINKVEIDQFAHSYYPKNLTETKYQHSISSESLQPWHQRFIDEEYEKVDQIGQSVRTKIIPVTWDLNQEFQTADGKQKKLISDALDFKLSTGYSIPYYDSNYEISLLVVHDKNIQTRFIKQPSLPFVLHQLGLYYHHHVSQLLHNKNKLSDVKLTARELECLKWSAMHKTAAEIANILKITPRTVGFHVENANKKLNCRNKYESICRLIQAGIIQL